MQKKNKIFDIRLLPMDISRLFLAIAFPFSRLKKRGLDGKKYRLKIKSGAIIAANHVGFADPLTIAVSLWFRRTFFLVAEVVMQKPILGAMLKSAGCIKIDRTTTDIEAIRRSVEVLKSGKLLLLFPQGKIVRDDEVNSIKSGAVLMAMQANVPIIPVYSGSRKHKLGFRTIVFGEPISCKDYCQKRMPSVADMEQISEVLLSKIEECKNTYEKLEEK